MVNDLTTARVYGLAALASILAPYSNYYLPGFIGIMIILTIIYSLFAIIAGHKPFDITNISNAMLFIIAWSLVYLSSMIVSSEYVPAIDWLYIYYAFLFIYLKNKIKVEAFSFFVRCFSILLLFSLIEFYVFFITNYSISSNVVYRGNGMVFNHLILNLVKVTQIPRFQFLADEPGLIGSLCAFILFAIGNSNRFSFEKIIIWIAGLTSFSLAFYVLAMIKLLFSKINFKTYFCVILVSIGLFNVLGEHIEKNLTERLQGYEIDNRTTLAFNRVFKESFDTGEIFLGKGYKSHRRLTGENEGNAGMKVFILSYGLIGTLLIFFVYNKIILTHYKYNKWSMLIFLFAFWLSFYQRQTIDRPYVIIVFFTFSLLNSNGLIPNKPSINMK